MQKCDGHKATSPLPRGGWVAVDRGHPGEFEIRANDAASRVYLAGGGQDIILGLWFGLLLVGLL
jgi:hypothetical protein